MSNQVYIKVDHVRTWLLSSSLAKFQQCQPEFFFSIFLQFISSWLRVPSWIDAFGDLVFHGVVWARLEMYFIFFLSENFFPVITHVFGMSLIFCTFCLHWWGFEFAPARGSLASVSDFIVNSQGYITVEHVRTWLLGSSFTKFLQFWSTCFFFLFSSVYFFLNTNSVLNCCV